MADEQLPAIVLMVVTDPAHPRARQIGRIVDLDANGDEVISITLVFNDGERVEFAPSQVRLQDV